MKKAHELAQEFGWTDEIKLRWINENTDRYPFGLESDIRISVHHARTYFNCETVVVIKSRYYYLFTAQQNRDNLQKFLEQGGADPDIQSMLELQRSRAYHA